MRTIWIMNYMRRCDKRTVRLDEHGLTAAAAGEKLSDRTNVWYPWRRDQARQLSWLLSATRSTFAFDGWTVAVRDSYWFSQCLEHLVSSMLPSDHHTDQKTGRDGEVSELSCLFTCSKEISELLSCSQRRRHLSVSSAERERTSWFDKRLLKERLNHALIRHSLLSFRSEQEFHWHPWHRSPEKSKDYTHHSASNSGVWS